MWLGLYVPALLDYLPVYYILFAAAHLLHYLKVVFFCRQFVGNLDKVKLS